MNVRSHDIWYLQRLFLTESYNRTPFHLVAKDSYDNMVNTNEHEGHLCFSNSIEKQFLIYTGHGGENLFDLFQIDIDNGAYQFKNEISENINSKFTEMHPTMGYGVNCIL